MGYRTKFKLSILPEYSFEQIDYHAKEISKLSGYETCFAYEIKWYDHEINMRQYSKNHPEIVFILKGEGDDEDDLWIEYYKNGKMQRSEIKLVYDQFDESKLF